MRRRTKADTYSTERASLAARMQAPPTRNGTHWQARAAVADDPILANRLSLAAFRGLPPIDLGAVPRHRHADAVEKALVAFEQDTSGGPCDYCGSIKRRFSSTPVGYLGNRDNTPPGFTVRGDRTACGWCSDVLREHNEQTLRVRVFMAAAGVHRLGGLSNPPGAAFAFEVPGLGNGTPWSHVSRDEARAVALDRLAVYCFATTQGAAEHVSMPGLPPYVWSAADLPHPKPKFFDHVSPMAAAAARDWEAMQKRTAMERERARARVADYNATVAGRPAAGLPT